MSLSSDIDAETRAAPPRAAPSPVQPLLWSVRRELWENRSVFIAPLAAAAVVLFGFMLGALHHASAHLDLPVQPSRALLYALPYAIGGLVVVVTSLIVAVGYCLGSLHGERRDRSLLFWKSLPLSDLTTVVSKAIVPLVILPAVAFAVAVGLTVIMLVVSSVTSNAPAPPLLQMWGILLYGLVAVALWYAPIYAWLMLVSGWARRATFLWAVLPPLALALFERLALGSSTIGGLIHQRLGGAIPAAFRSPPDHAPPLPVIDLAGFLATPGLWLGLVAAAALFAAAVWRRRRAEPI